VRDLAQLCTSTANSRHRALSLALQGRRVNHDRYAVLAFVTSGCPNSRVSMSPSGLGLPDAIVPSAQGRNRRKPRHIEDVVLRSFCDTSGIRAPRRREPWQGSTPVSGVLAGQARRATQRK
jgi:hypothetical protein